jgi:hypothetical protein
VKEVVRVTDAIDPSNYVLAGDFLSPGKTAEIAASCVLS